MKFSKTKFVAIILVVILALSYMLSGCSSWKKKKDEADGVESSQPLNSPDADNSNSDDFNGNSGTDTGESGDDQGNSGDEDSTGDGSNDSQEGSSGEDTDSEGNGTSSDDDDDWGNSVEESDDSVIIFIEEEELTEEEENLVDNDGAMPTEDQLDADKLIKATWKQPNRVLVNWAPDEDWIPEDGYSLFRIINEDVVLLAGNLGTEGFVDEMASGSVFNDFLIPAFDTAKVTSDKFATLGISDKDQFKTLFTIDQNAGDKIIPSADLFEDIQNGSIPSTQAIVERVPFEDTVGNFSISLIAEINAPEVTLSGYQGAFSDTPAELLLTPVISPKELMVTEIMEARSTYVTMALINPQFSIESGLGYEDDFGEEILVLNTEITYVLVQNKEGMPSINQSNIEGHFETDGVSHISVSYGAETPLEVPENLDGFGFDGSVGLRWDPTETEYGKSIITGYNIERKIKGETEFVKVNGAPIVIGYTEDENGNYVENPVFYTDNGVENGDIVYYRIQSIDIFGRKSEYDDGNLSVEIIKTLPPSTPTVEEPVLSIKETNMEESEFVIEMKTLNSGKTGVILSMMATSDDTNKFVIYRSEAEGTDKFSDPVKLTEISAVDFNAKTNQTIEGAVTLKIPAGDQYIGNIVSFFDINIDAGSYYKYWVAAEDDYDNESGWSMSRIAGYPLDAPPVGPGSVSADFKNNKLANLAVLPVGIMPLKIQDMSLFAMTTAITGPAVGLSLEPVPGVDTAFAATADSNNIFIGRSFSETIRLDDYAVPELLDVTYGNLPNSSDVHSIVAMANEDVPGNGNITVSWYHYSGENIKGYNIFRAIVDNADVNNLQDMSRQEIIESYRWELAEANTVNNQFQDSVTKKSGRVFLYMVSIIPLDTEEEKDDVFSEFTEGGWVTVKWNKPSDSQVSYYKVYRAEVNSFSGLTYSNLDWVLVQDRLEYSSFIQEVDQDIGHNYVYKVVSVSVWGVETEDPGYAKIRVDGTVPPSTPNMLIPMSSQDKIEVRWEGVANAVKYVVFRHKIPKVNQSDITSLMTNSPNVFDTVFDTSRIETIVEFKNPGDYVIEGPQSSTPGIMDIDGTISSTLLESAVAKSATKFNISAQMGFESIKSDLETVSTSEKLKAYQDIANKYGATAVIPYWNLDVDLRETIEWDTVKTYVLSTGQDSTEVFSYIDTDVEFGETYLYTVQAFSEDNLGSTRPEPVEAVTRKSVAFPKVTGLRKNEGEDGNASYLSWNPAKDPNLTTEESKEYIVGYIVYRSDRAAGPYHQVSTLLSDTQFFDAGADRYAEKYYKVKVVDIGGFMSGFSDYVMIKDEWTFVFFMPIITISKITEEIPDITASTGLFPIISMPPIPVFTPLPSFIPITPEDYTISGYELKDVTLSGDSGPGNLLVAGEYLIPVTVTANTLSGSEITDGSVTIEEAVIIGDTGICFDSLQLNTSTKKAIVSGYAKNAGSSTSRAGGNLLGELYALEFTESTLTTLGEIVINEVDNFWYNEFYLFDISGASINIDKFESSSKIVVSKSTGRLPGLGGIITTQRYGSEFINIFAGKAQSAIGFDTVDNVMLDFTFSSIEIGSDFKADVEFNLVGDDQLLQPVIPAGLCLLVEDAKMVIENGVISAAAGNIRGKIILPFDKAEDFEIINNASRFSASSIFMNADSYAIASGFNQIMGANPNSSTVNSNVESVLDGGMFQIGDNAQKHGLLVASSELVELVTSGMLEYDDGISKIDFDVNSFDGNGFIVTNKVLAPTYVGEVRETDESTEKDYSSCVGVYGSNVVVDLSKTKSYASAVSSYLKDSSWMGMIVNQGQVALPPDIVKTDDDKWVKFDLNKEDLIYDRNGFSYQNQVYYQNEIPVNLGEKAGLFKDAYIKSAFIDIYANKAYFEMTGSVGIPLFDYQRVNIHIYVADPEAGAETDADEDGLADDKSSTSHGGTIISVAPTDKFDPSGTGEVMLKITGGTIATDGITLDGTLDLIFEDRMDVRNAHFSGLTIPADPKGLTEVDNPDGILGRAVFDKAIPLIFSNFNMEARSISLLTKTGSSQSSVSNLPGYSRIAIPRVQKFEYGTVLTDSSQVTTYSTDITIWGGMQLSDSVSLDTEEDFDRVVITDVFTNPDIDLDECKTEVEIPFEGFLSMKMVSTPEPVLGDDTLVEYKGVENAESKFENACEKLQWSDIKVNARFGYDSALERTFYAMAIYYKDKEGISFGTGSVNEMTALVANNMVLEMDLEKGTFKIPDDDEGLFNLVDTMKVDRDATQSIFTLAAKCTISFETKGVKTSELRDVYLIVQNGPSFEMGGEYYAIKDVKALKSTNSSSTNDDNLKLIGSAKMGYYAQTETLKISISIKEIKAFGWKLSGDLGFEMSPYFWQLDIGYPTMLVAQMKDGKKAGFGISLRYNYEAYPEDIEEGTIADFKEDHVKVKAMFGYKTTKDVEIGCVYFSAEIEVGGEGEYYFDSEKIVISVYLKGNAKGGVKFNGKKYSVIEVSVDANGVLKREEDDWNLKADMKIKYHLDLKLTTISGTKNWDFEKDF